MQLETYSGTSVPDLFAQARADIGPDAVLLSVRRPDPHKSLFEVIAADPATAETWRRAQPQAPRTWKVARPISPEAAAPVSPARTSPEPPRRLHPGRPRVIAVTGPTGAGKTTTIAKLANHHAAFGDKRVGLISLDTFRLGAAEQLKAYAKISKVKCEVVYDLSDVSRALNKLRDCEVILVDTPGRTSGEWGEGDALRAVLLALDPDETHLALPAGIAPTLAWRVVSEGKSEGATHILPTKLDEFPGLDLAVSFSEQFEMPITWMADGRRVPMDLRAAAEVPRLARATVPEVSGVAALA